jgi:diguanylate cyclase (GGDEF)-like protein
MDDQSRTTLLNRALRAAAAACVALVGALGIARADVIEEMLFTRLGPQDGLSQGSVLVIRNDAKGFLWFGTEDGLNRYDGYQLLHLVRDRKNPLSLPNNWVAAIAEHPDGRLFVGTDGAGVVWRDPRSGAFHVPQDADGNPLVALRASVRALLFDRNQNLWVGTRRSGLIKVDLQAHTTTAFTAGDGDNSLSDDSIFGFAEDNNGQLWVATRGGLDRIDTASGKVTRYAAAMRRLTTDEGIVQLNSVLVERRGLIWIGTNAGLLTFDSSANTWRLWKAVPEDLQSLPDKRVNALLEDDEARLWVGTSNGLGLLDRRSGQFTAFRKNPADTATLPDNHIVSLHQDPNGLLWVGTKSGGMARWNPRSWSFGHRRLANAETNNVTSFAEDRKGRLWIGTLGSGLQVVDRRTNEATRFTGPKRDPFTAEYVMALVADETNYLWVGTMRSGVARIDTRSGAVTRFPFDPADENAIPSPGIMSLMRDSRERLWVGTFGGGLARIDPASGRMTRYPIARDGQQGLSGDRATALAEDRSGFIWVGTDGGGINVLDPTSGRIVSFQHAQDDPNSLGANTVYSIHVDNRGEVWIGTRGGGLDRALGEPFSSAGLRFENYSESEGLPNSTVYGVQSDSTGQLWVSTNRGIASFDPRTKAFRTFLRSHGLQADEFNFGAHHRTSSGELLFGGANGYNVFLPERLRFNDKPPSIALTGFLKLNEPGLAANAYDSMQKMSLGYRDDVITFEFAALDFTAPAQNRYAYKLEGFDTDWVDAGKSRQATYTNLSGGTYKFHVRGANSDGVWNDTGFTVDLEVESPPWARWWAYLLYAAAFLLAMYTVWAQQQKKFAREAAYARRLQAEVEERTRELAVRNTQLEHANHQLQEASRTDPLTGLGNRRSLYDAVTTLLTKRDASEGGHRFVLMVIDLDRLKPINDQYGHEAGDNVLMQIADLLRHISRASDLVVRWGGDEFVVVCRDADMGAAELLAERIRSSVAKQLYRVSPGTVARTSCSIGFATYPFVAEAPEQTTWEQALALADAALYQAKRTRNNWVGYQGTARAARLPNLVQLVETDAEQLAQDGFLIVRHRDVASDDTVDRILALGSRTE